jgi:preprotein translocase subunit SecE
VGNGFSVGHLQRKASFYTKKIDYFLWLFVVLIILAIIAGNLYFNTVNINLRATTILILALIALGLAGLTQKGKLILIFIKEARLELRKVVWPTRQETLRTSFLIFLIVVLMSLILWGVDSLFALLVSSIVM